MYSPKYAIEADRQKIDTVIRENPFATLVFVQNNQVQNFHLPLIIEGEKLLGHMARANFAWPLINGQEVLVIFHGPHAYISPVWYGTDKNVPTWNYISVQVRGKVTIHEDEPFLKKALLSLGENYDPKFAIGENIGANQELLKAIVGIEISVDSTFGKFKLAQSKSEQERLNVILELEKSSNSQKLAVAQAMRETLSRP